MHKWLLCTACVLGCAPNYWPPNQSVLVPGKCARATTGDSTALIRVLVEPKQAQNSSLSLLLAAITPGRPDSEVARPALGIDSIPNLAPGLYRLWVRVLGYHHPRDTIRVNRGEVSCITAQMVSSKIHLEPVTN